MPELPPIQGRGSTLTEVSSTDDPIGAASQIIDDPLVSWTRVRHSLTNGVRLDQIKAGQMLLRKEVIQPHLLVRLPCYDFVPIASPTFDGSLHKGWATGFGCCRLS